MSQANQNSSSSVLSLLLGDISRYVSIMDVHSKRLQEIYPNKHLSKIFSLLPKKLITIAPMALCDDFTQDFGSSCTDDVLSGIGLCSLWITTHDDVVDELPRIRHDVSSLVYAGNIAVLEGMSLLIKSGNASVAENLSKSIAQNHYDQQLRVELAWDAPIKNFEEYQKAIEDVYSLAMIGPSCALLLTNKNEFKENVEKFCFGYAIVLQLIDDLLELDEDRASGYHSFSLYEGEPFTRTFQEINNHLRLAEKALHPDWKKTPERLNQLKDFIQIFKAKFEESWQAKRL